MSVEEITPALLRQLLAHDADGGKLFWKPRENNAQWSAVHAGREAFTAINSSGYRAGTLFGHGVLAHRAIWAIVHGEWPAGDIDHVNHDRLDNRIANLRVVTRAENARNRVKPRNSPARRVGVNWNARLGKWCAVGSIDGRTVHLGTYANFDDACARRERFERERDYHPNHGLQREAA